MNPIDDGPDGAYCIGMRTVRAPAMSRKPPMSSGIENSFAR